ncbi:MAG: hypothetical protein ACLGIB_12675 [Actinomycetota bacterium]
MEEAQTPGISAVGSIREGFSQLLRKPFRGITLLSILIALVLESLPDQGDTATLLAALLLLVLSLYLQITMTLAAAEDAPSESVDEWLKQALARRCWWRFAAVSVLVMLAVIVSGVVGLVVGAFIVGGILALTDPAVVLENRAPAEAVARSAQLSKPARRPLAIVFGLLVLIPGVSVQVGTMVWDLEALFGPAWIAVPLMVMVLGLAGTIALTRAFMALGGSVLPTRPRVSVENRS